MQVTALSTILFSLIVLVTAAPLQLFEREPCGRTTLHPKGCSGTPYHRSVNNQESTFPALEDELSTRTPSATIQFNLATDEEAFQFGFGLNDLATINAGQQKALKNAITSVQVLGDNICDIFADQGGHAILATGVGNEVVTLGDGNGVAVGAVKCTQ